MTRLTLIAALTALAAPALAEPALAAPALAEPALRPLSSTVLAFEQRGYDVRSAEDDGRTHEVEAVNPQGQRIEAVVDAATGEVLREHPDD